MNRANVAGMKPLEGVRVVELASVVPGPYAGMILADQGADVIRWKAPTATSAGLWSPTSPRVRLLPTSTAATLIVVDVRRNEGREIVLRLLSEADVVTENWRPGVAARLGLDAADWRSQFPRLITAGFGLRRGPVRR